MPTTETALSSLPMGRVQRTYVSQVHDQLSQRPENQRERPAAQSATSGDLA
jgi:hypothetical protein